jgi:actin-related protein
VEFNTGTTQRGAIAAAGETFRIGSERFQGPEAVFFTGHHCIEGDSIGGDGGGPCGLHQWIYDTIMRCPQEIRKDMFGLIVLSGGNTMVPGLAERLGAELRRLAPSDVEVKVLAPANRHVSAWIGGRELSQTMLHSRWLTMGEYDEGGPTQIHGKAR